MIRNLPLSQTVKIFSKIVTKLIILKTTTTTKKQKKQTS